MTVPRCAHQFYAWLFRYFWLPCPSCGRMFGGHEGPLSSIPKSGDGEGGSLICPQCSRVGIGDRAAELQGIWEQHHEKYGRRVRVEFDDTGRKWKVLESPSGAVRFARVLVDERCIDCGKEPEPGEKRLHRDGGQWCFRCLEGTGQ